MNDAKHYDWSVAVFASNEASALKRCIDSIELNAKNLSVQVTIILNGTRDNSLEVIKSGSWPTLDISVFQIAAADKANAINQVIHHLRPLARLFFFADGYVKIHPNAMRHLEKCLQEDPYPHIASALWTNGRSAKMLQAQVMRGGSVTGGLFAARPEFLDRLRDENIRMPVGLYRGDGLISSWANNDLDGIGHPWDVRRVKGVAEASFEISALSAWRWKDIVRQFRREIRQARGDMENGAIKVRIRAEGFRGLPAHADDLIRSWKPRKGDLPGSLRKRFFRLLALRQLQRFSPPSAQALEPHLVFQNRGPAHPRQMA